MVVITLDTTRADRLGCYGYGAAVTGTIDALALRGVLFEHAYATAPLTLPAHASLFTGLYPKEHGLRTNGKHRLDADLPTLAEVMSEHGYETGAFVASFVLDEKFGLSQGFDYYGDDLTGTEPTDEALHRSRSGNFVIDEALRWLGEQTTQPFFCWIHLYDPHAPYLEHRDEFGDRFQDRPYDAEIAYVDLQISRLLQFLQSRRLDESTMIVVIGDHGEGLGDHHERRHGMMLYNATMHVPFVMALPGTLPAGRRIPAPVSQVDFLPTLLDILQLDGGFSHSGRSLLSMIRGDNVPTAAIYGETDEPLIDSGWSSLQSLTTAEWKYIRTSRPELYDMTQDPAELHNLAGERADVSEQLEQDMAELEAGMETRRAGHVQLSQQEERALSGLGYVGSSRTRVQGDLQENRPDIKDMIVHYNALEDAHVLLEQGEYDRAIRQFQQLAAAAPDYELAATGLGDALFRQGNVEAAIRAYTEVLQKNPENSLAHFHLGDALGEQGNYAAAVACYEQALEREPDSAKLHYNLARTLILLGNDDEASSHLERALENDPGFVFALIELGNVNSRRGLLTRALLNYRKALEYQ